MNNIQNQTIELTISDLAYEGKGFAKIDGMIVFVNNAIPMDNIIAKIVKKKKNYVEAKIVEIIKPSPFRVPPKCKYSGYCGGCKIQYLDYNKQIEYKEQHVKDCLEHIGLLKNIIVKPMIASKNIFGYRNKMEFSCSDKRWILPDEMGKNEENYSHAVGFHAPNTFHKVIDIDECFLQPELGNQILCDVKHYIKDSGIPIYGIKSHEGFWRFLMLRHSKAFDQWMVNIITAYENYEKIKIIADFLIEKYPNISSIVNNITSKKSAVAYGEYENCIRGNPFIKEKIGNYLFEISSNSFFQTNSLSALELYNKVKEYSDLKGNETVADLYCGTGTIAIWLSDIAKKVIGMELVKSAIEDAEKNCKNNNISNCQFIQGDIKNIISTLTEKPDIMIIDPPRTGMHKDVIKQVINLSPEKIVYVSCNPATLARDLSMLKNNYDILEIQPIDMFPHTYHIESVAKLKKI